MIPVDYQLTGQPVLIGGTMGTCSYVLTGTERGMLETFGSTCHGAVSRPSRRRRAATSATLTFSGTHSTDTSTWVGAQ